ncbi:MAG: signal peptide peptidase SppA [Victivallales bacterium]|nr:signal peptide peptidase SppA [Victivallales bacterium]
MEQHNENNTPPPISNLTVNASKKNHGCLWFALGFVAFCFVAFGAVAIFAALIAGALTSIKETEKDQFESYKRKFISGDKASKNTILVVPVNGVIVAGENPSPFASSMASAEKICQYLKMAKKDNSVKAVIVQINSPGGEVVASDEIHHAVMQVRKSGKPVVAVIGTMGASGGYYIACASDKIIAHRLSITGSIGVIIQNFKYYDLLKKIGVKSDTYTSCKYKDILSGARPEKIGERAIIQGHIDKVYKAFIQIVADGRPQLSYKGLENSIITDGRIFLGSEALKLKLIDKLGFFDDAVETAAKLSKLKDYRVVAYKKKFSFSALFNANAGAKSANINVKLLGKNKSMIEAGKFYYMPIQ